MRKLYARYEAALGGLITNKFKKHMCYTYSRAVRFIYPTLNFEVNDIVGLSTSLNEGPFIDLALSSLTCKLYHEYGHLLAPIEAAIITSSHLTLFSKSFFYIIFQCDFQGSKIFPCDFQRQIFIVRCFQF